MAQPDTIIDADAYRRIRTRDRTHGICAAHAMWIMHAAGYSVGWGFHRFKSSVGVYRRPRGG